MAARQCSDKGFFRVDRLFNGKRKWNDKRGRRGCDLDSAIETPSVVGLYRPSVKTDPSRSHAITALYCDISSTSYFETFLVAGA